MAHSRDTVAKNKMEEPKKRMFCQVDCLEDEGLILQIRSCMLDFYAHIIHSSVFKWSAPKEILLCSPIVYFTMACG